MNKESDDAYWFLKSNEEIIQMREKLPKAPTPEADELLAALEKSTAQDCTKDFLQSYIDYMKIGLDHKTALQAAIEDWL